MQLSNGARGGAVLALLMLAAVALAACIPSAQTAPVQPGIAAVDSTAPPAATAPAEPTPQKSGSASAAAPAASSGPAVRVIPATVVRVVDGDTAVFRLESGAQEKVRFIGVDTPESTTQVEVYGKEASAYTKRSLTVGKRVFLEKDVEERDRYGRMLAYVWLAKPGAAADAEIRSKMFNARLALDGYAQQMTIQPNSRYAEYFSAYVREARTADKGLWDPSLISAVAPVPAAAPAASPSSGGGYVGNGNTMKFHKPACSSVSDMNPANQVALASRDQAISQGFVPCKRCNP